MPGLLGYAAAGALAGAGEGIAAQGRRSFEAMQEELRQTRLDERQTRSDDRADDRQKRADTRADARTDLELGSISKFDVDSNGYKIGLNARGESVRITDESGKPIRQQAEKPGYSVKQNADGMLVYVPDRPGSPAVPVRDASGQPVSGKPPKDPDALTPAQRASVVSRALKSATTKSASPTQPDTVDWGAFTDDLRIAGVAIDDDVRRRVERGLREELAGEVSTEAERRKGEENLVFPDKPADYGGLSREQWEKQELDRRVNERMVELGLADERAVPQPDAQTASTGRASANPPAPRDPALRQVGQIYDTPAMGPMKWMGNGWQAVQ